MCVDGGLKYNLKEAEILPAGFYSHSASDGTYATFAGFYSEQT